LRLCYIIFESGISDPLW